MTEPYFRKFKTVRYNGRDVVNITERAAILDSVSANPYVWYPYDIVADERPDQFANRYYGDPFLSWLVYLSNGIIDPYYGWVLTDTEFQEFIRKKYGSIEEADRLIVHLRNNWYTDHDGISVSRHAALDVQELKYWEPVYSGTRITSYSRKREDWVLNTNRIVRYDLANTAGTFARDQKVTINIDATHSGNAQVIVANSTSMSAQHVEGTYLANSTVVVSANSVLSTPTGNAHVTNTHLLAENIGIVEEKYWDRIKAFDLEFEKNSQNRSIRVLDKQYAPQVVFELKKLLG